MFQVVVVFLVNTLQNFSFCIQSEHSESEINKTCDPPNQVASTHDFQLTILIVEQSAAVISGVRGVGIGGIPLPHERGGGGGIVADCAGLHDTQGR